MRDLWPKVSWSNISSLIFKIIILNGNLWLNNNVKLFLHYEYIDIKLFIYPQRRINQRHKNKLEDSNT